MVETTSVWARAEGRKSRMEDNQGVDESGLGHGKRGRALYSLDVIKEIASGDGFDGYARSSRMVLG